MDEILLNLLKEYKEKSDAILFQCASLDAEIRKLTETRNMIAKPYQDSLIEIENKIRMPMMDRKATFTSDVGKITYRKGAVRRSWNLDALDQICASKMEVKEAIWAFRDEKTGEPTISIKLE